MMPEFRVRERALLESLHRFGVTEEGCVQAWFSFPHSMRIFYIHAYSSRIWNEAASYRLATYGPTVVEGDLICLDGDADEHFPSSKVSTRHGGDSPHQRQSLRLLACRLTEKAAENQHVLLSEDTVNGTE